MCGHPWSWIAGSVPRIRFCIAVKPFGRKITLRVKEVKDTWVKNSATFGREDPPSRVVDGTRPRLGGVSPEENKSRSSRGKELQKRHSHDDWWRHSKRASRVQGKGKKTRETHSTNPLPFNSIPSLCV